MNKVISLSMVAFFLVLVGAGCNQPKTTDVMAPTDQAMNGGEENLIMKDEPSPHGDRVMGKEGDIVEEPAMVEKDSGAMKNDSAMMEKKPMEKSGAMMVKAGSYEDYSVDKVSRAATGKVVLFFKAGWCGTCAGVDKDIVSNLGTIPANTSILKIDYDTAAELKKKYGVTYQHTFVQVDAEGKMLAKWSGSATLSELLKQIK